MGQPNESTEPTAVADPALNTEHGDTYMSPEDEADVESDATPQGDEPLL